MFFKQKTAYEMCGRDWSSDVCSSDLTLKFLLQSKPALKYYRCNEKTIASAVLLLVSTAHRFHGYSRKKDLLLYEIEAIASVLLAGGFRLRNQYLANFHCSDTSDLST